MIRQLPEDLIAKFLVEWPCLEAVSIEPDVAASTLRGRRLCRRYQSASSTLPRVILLEPTTEGEKQPAPTGVASNTADSVAAVVLQRESKGSISEVDSLGGIVRHERRNHRIALG
jgi:hypothetical protein